MRKIGLVLFLLLLIASLYFVFKEITAHRFTLYTIDDSHSAKTKTVGERIEFIIIHFTHGDFDESLGHLKHGPVSAHYLIPEDKAHGDHVIYRLVGDDLKAAHAGKSYWQGYTQLNSSSIGIELVNLGFEDEEGQRRFYPYSEYQINLLIALLNDLIVQYDIEPTHIIGHSDITQNIPERGGNTRVDPGPLFPWERLSDYGIGAWYEADEVEEIIDDIEDEVVDIKTLQQYLATYGYNIKVTGELDQQTKNVVKAFQMHFRPENYSGIPDHETYAIAENLVEKYF